MASILEKTGTVNKVHISEKTRNGLGDTVVCSPDKDVDDGEGRLVKTFNVEVLDEGILVHRYIYIS